MRTADLIHKKREGEALTAQEIDFLIRGYTAGEIPDYQMAAFAMAVFFRGMTRQETVLFTDAMQHSGDSLDLTCFGTLSADKHSTGGVGDKTTLIVGPIVAALGGKMAKMSGRGLGHTGGTIDKLESIPGFRTELTKQAFLQQVQQYGIAVVSQSGNLVPADKKLYALRDVTATVDSLPLIVSSVMSKKLAAGAHSIVLDVKVGSGAFMKTLDEARTLAREMVEIGKHCGRNVAAVLSNMDAPLGFCVGNALEVAEAVQILQGNGPADLRELCITLSAVLLSLIYGWQEAESRRQVLRVLDSGAAFQVMKQWVQAQGGDSRALEDPALLPQSAITQPVCAVQSGYLGRMDTEKIGEASAVLGAGRAVETDQIDPAAGIRFLKKPGDRVTAGEPLAMLYTNRPDTLETARALLLQACHSSAAAPAPQPLVYEIIR